MNRYLFTYFFIVTLFVSCKKALISEIEIINSEQSNRTRISTLFQEINFIPLETTIDGLIGLDVKKIEIFDDKIFALNILSSHSNILCFSKESGKFLFKIDRIGKGPNEYTYLGNFLIDKYKKQIILLVEQGRYLYFDLEGNYLHDEKATDNYTTRQILQMNDSTLLAYNDATLPPEGYNILYVDSKTLNIRAKSNDIQDYIKSSVYSPLCIHNENTLFYNTDDSIHNLEDGKVMYFTNFGEKHNKSKHYLSNFQNNNSHEAYLEEFIKLFVKNEFFLVRSIIENQKWVIINAYKNRGAEELDGISFFLLYEKASKKVYHSEDLIFDIMNLSHMQNMCVLFANDDELYCLIKEDFSADDLKKIKHSSLSPENKERILGRSFEDNPILLHLKN